MIRKSEADKVPLSPSESVVPGKITAIAKVFYCSKGYDMLNVDLSMDGEVAARYFADPVTKEHKGFLIGEKWGAIKLDNLVHRLEGEPKRNWPYCNWYQAPKWDWEDDSNKSVRIVRSILGSSIDLWESRNDSEKYYKRVQTKYDRLQQKINNLLRPTPEGFKEWAESCFSGAAAVLTDGLLQELGIYEYQCTECAGKWARKRRYRGNRIITCPDCGKELRVENGNLVESAGFYLIQTCAGESGGWYERYIHGHRRWSRKEGWELGLTDVVLAVVESGERLGKVYYREGQGYSETRHNGFLPAFGKGYIYPDMGEADAIMTAQQERCLKALAARGMNVNANAVIIRDTDNGLEYLIKGGYERLAEDVIAGRVYGLDGNADNFEDYIGLDKQRCLRLKQINGSARERDWLRYEKMTGRKVSAADLEFFILNKIDPNDTFYGTRTMLEYIPSPAAFRHYLEKQSNLSGRTFRQTTSDYQDYIRIAKSQGLNLTSEIFFKPKDLKAAHDECVRVAHEKEYENRAKEIEAKFPKVPQILKAIQSKYTYEAGEFAIVVPEKIEDIIAEGRALGHCIDTTDRYFERIQNHVTYLVFLRHAGAKSTSWYTLEIEPGGTVRQQRTTGNRQNKADTEAYMPFIREWQKTVRQRISEEDKAAAQRSREMRIAEYEELREKKETVRNGLLAGQLLVDVLEADLVEAM